MRLSSPRTRRKLVRVAIALAAAGGVALGISALPSYGTKRKEVFDSRPVKVLKAQKQVRLTAAERRAVDAVIGTFVSAGVERRDPLRAYALSTPTLRQSATRAEWRRGDLPVLPYRGSGAPGWTLDYAYPGDAVVDVVIHPAKDEPTHRAIIFTSELKRVGGRWLVDSMIPSATFGDGTVYSRVDMAPQAVAAAPAKAPLGKAWILAPIGLIVGLIVLVPGGILLGRWLRDRRAAAAIR
jgi:hypothetical protein